MLSWKSCECVEAREDTKRGETERRSYSKHSYNSRSSAIS